MRSRGGDVGSGGGAGSSQSGERPPAAATATDRLDGLPGPSSGSTTPLESVPPEPPERVFDERDMGEMRLLPFGGASVYDCGCACMTTTGGVVERAEAESCCAPPGPAAAAVARIIWLRSEPPDMWCNSRPAR